MHLNLNVGVYGTGAVGLFYSSFLLQAKKCNVHFLLRSDYDFISNHGITMKSDIFDDLHHDSSTFSYYKSPSDMDVDLDFILICSKTIYNDEIISDILPQLVKPSTAIIILQNGLDNELPFATAFPSNNVIGGIALVCAQRLSSGVVHHIDHGSLLLGPHNCSPDVVQRFADLFLDSGMQVSITADLRLARFMKLVFNVILNGLSVVLSAHTSQLTSLDRLLSVEEVIGDEVCKVAESVECFFPKNFVSNSISNAKKMAKYKPSMLVDYEAKRPLELEYLYFKLLSLAAKNGVEVPMCTMLAAQLEMLDARNRGLI
ncbi:hypothetical protein P9112_013454 [Eukaryota sp. TZLM1-RC]